MGGGRNGIQLEKGICNLQHEDMWVIVFMADEDSLASSTHAMLLVVLLQSPQARENRGILLWLVLFSPEGVVAERVETNCRRLIGIERLGNDRPIRLVFLLDDSTEAKWVEVNLRVRRLLRESCDGRHCALWICWINEGRPLCFVCSYIQFFVECAAL